MIKALVIGKNGQLAKSLIKNASAFGFEVTSLGRDELDVRDENALTHTIEEIAPEVIMNTAAYNLVAKCEDAPEEAFALNFKGVLNLARICKKSRVQFVTFSTDYVFDGETRKPNEEHVAPNPLQVYGISKLAGEYAARNYYPEGSFVVRTSSLYGGGKMGSPSKGNFVLNILKEAENKDMIQVSVEQIVSPTFSDDLSGATFNLLKKEAPPGLYHIANEGYCSLAEFASEIFASAGIDKKVMPIDRSGQRGSMRVPKFSALKNVKASAIGITLPSWKDALRRYIIEL